MRTSLLPFSLLFVLLFALATACGGEVATPTAEQVVEPATAVAAPAQAAAAEAAGDRAFGEPLAVTDVTALSDIAGEPTRFEGQVVRTTGEIASVCQRMGCWMEIREEGVDSIRVPMAGHGFFLPRDVAGRRATLEGVVSIRELPEAEREHLAGEGALATAQPIQIAATGVIIH